MLKWKLDPSGQELTENIASLTSRELEVLQLIAEGHQSIGAADQLCLSKRTIDFHLARVYRKLGVTNRMLAVRAASRLGVLDGEARVLLTDTVQDADAAHDVAGFVRQRKDSQ